MLAEFLEDRAALYVAGAMTAPERENFELVLAFHTELQAHVAGLQEAMAATALSRVPAALTPPAALRSRLLAALGAEPPPPEPESLVVTDPAGYVEWVNPAFTTMCGYSLEELQGNKPGSLLQGPDTDPATVARLRAALRAGAACRETITNYHKDGSAYQAEIRITPIRDDEEHLRWFVAQERKLAPAGAGR
jgi:PAS domain S-box-containing protein